MSPGSTRQRTTRVTVVGHIGGANFGDELMLDTLLDHLPAAPGIEVTVLTKDPETTRRAHPGARTARLRRADLRGHLRTLLSTDALVLSGGTHFTDTFRGRRLAYQHLSTLKYATLGAATRARGGTVIWVGVGIGPLHRGSSRVLTRLALATTTRVIVRDQASAAAARRCGTHAEVGADLAIPQLTSRRGRGRALSAGRSTVLAPTQLLSGSSGTTIAPAMRRYVAAMVGAAEDVRAAGCEVVWLALKGRGTESDMTVLDSIRAAGGVQPEDRVVAFDGANVDEVLALIDDAQLCIVSRYHATMAAILRKRPTIVLPYHQKVRDLATQLGLDRPAVLDPFTPGLEPRLRHLMSDALSSPVIARPPEPGPEVEGLVCTTVREISRIGS